MIKSIARAFLALMLGIGIVMISLSDRSQFLQLLIYYAISFGAYLYILNQEKSRFIIRFWIIIAVFIRIILVFVFPNLSDDVYRFLWDGRLILSAINPFTALPAEIIESGQAIRGIDRSLFNLLNSPSYFSVYPPVCQFTFLIAALVSPENINTGTMTLKVLFLVSECATLLLLTQCLKRAGKSSRHVLIYALNPLVILEFCGNLHFEALMILFLLVSYILLEKQKIFLSAGFFGLSVATKLIPVIFLPFLLRRMPVRSLMGYYAFVAIIIFACFSPLWTTGISSNFSESLKLYFQSFEFNASIYYLARWIGFQARGYNLIASIGPIMAICTLFGLSLVLFVERNPKIRDFPKAIVIALTVYLLFATTVHPWYVCTIIAFTPLTNLRYPIAWSGLIFLSYASYQTLEYQENLALVGVEYSLLAITVYLEFFKKLKVAP